MLGRVCEWVRATPCEALSVSRATKNRVAVKHRSKRAEPAPFQSPSVASVLSPLGQPALQHVKFSSLRRVCDYHRLAGV